MGKIIDLTNKELEELTDEELEVLENQGLIEKRKSKDEKPKIKTEVRTK